MKWIDQHKPSLFTVYLGTVFALLLVVTLSLFVYEALKLPFQLVSGI